MPAASRRKPSGPLDERLVVIAEELLDRDGLEAISLRRIARRAGVSHGAPLRHYPSLAALLSEVAARGFRLLSETIDKSAAQLPSGAGPWARLAAAGRGYVELAVARPGLFALMFRPEALDAQNPALVQASAEAFEQLVRLVRAAQDAGWRAEHDTRLLSGCVWAAVHGLALLWAQGAFTVAAAASGATLDDALRTIMQLVHDDPRGGIR